MISPYEHIEGNYTVLTLGVMKHSNVDKMSNCKLPYMEPMIFIVLNVNQCYWIAFKVITN